MSAVGKRRNATSSKCSGTWNKKEDLKARILNAPGNLVPCVILQPDTGGVTLWWEKWALQRPTRGVCTAATCTHIWPGESFEICARTVCTFRHSLDRVMEAENMHSLLHEYKPEQILPHCNRIGRHTLGFETTLTKCCSSPLDGLYESLLKKELDRLGSKKCKNGQFNTTCTWGRTKLACEVETASEAFPREIHWCAHCSSYRHAKDGSVIRIFTIWMGSSRQQPSLNAWRPHFVLINVHEKRTSILGFQIAWTHSFGAV